MVYLILCGFILCIEVVCVILYMLPLVELQIIPQYDWIGERELYKNNIFDYLDKIDGIFSFSLTIVSIILVVILLVYSVKVFAKRIKSAKFCFVFNIITSVVLLLNFYFYVRFRNGYTWDVSGYSGVFYYYKRTATPIVLVIFILQIVSISFSLIMQFIVSVYCFSSKLKYRFFFNLVGKGVEEIKKGSEQSNTTKDNIDLLIKINELKKEGIITEEEFEDKKKELL